MSSWAKPVKSGHFEVNETNRNEFVNSIVTESSGCDDEFFKSCKGNIGSDFWEEVRNVYEHAYGIETESKLYTGTAFRIRYGFHMSACFENTYSSYAIFIIKIIILILKNSGIFIFERRKCLKFW